MNCFAGGVDSSDCNYFWTGGYAVNSTAAQQMLYQWLDSGDPVGSFTGLWTSTYPAAHSLVTCLMYRANPAGLMNYFGCLNTLNFVCQY